MAMRGGAASTSAGRATAARRGWTPAGWTAAAATGLLPSSGECGTRTSVPWGLEGLGFRPLALRPAGAQILFYESNIEEAPLLHAQNFVIIYPESRLMHPASWSFGSPKSLVIARLPESHSLYM